MWTYSTVQKEPRLAAVLQTMLWSRLEPCNQCVLNVWNQPVHALPSKASYARFGTSTPATPSAIVDEVSKHGA